MLWTLEYNGTEKTLADWGIDRSSVQRRLVSQEADTLSLVSTKQLYDATELFPYGSTIKIYRDRTYFAGAYSGGRQWFLGRVIKISRSGSGRSESIAYEVAGPWFWLDNIVFQQTWNFKDAFGQTVAGQSSHLFLGQTATGTPQTTGQQITEILQWAVTCGAPLAIGTISPALNIPVHEVRDTTCGEAIRQMLAYHPDCVAWFDYSTTLPTLHIKPRSTVSACTLDIGTDPVTDININPRHDLQRPAVVLKFEQTNQVDGVGYLAQAIQKAPSNATGNELGALVATINLQGWSKTTARVTTRAISPTSTTWWEQHLPWLTDGSVTSFSVVNGSTSRESSLPREAIPPGQLAPWMGIGAEEDTVKATLSIQWAAGTDKQNEATKAVSVGITATDAPLGETVYDASFESGEPEPTGLAQGLYDATKDLQYEGSITLKEEDVNRALIAAGITNSYGVGVVLNLTSGRSEWATMRALIQEVTETIDTGETTFSFGPAGHLGASDLMELLRLHSKRFKWTPPAARTDPQISAQGQTSLAEHTPKSQANSGATKYQQLWVAKLANSLQLDMTGSTPKFEMKDASKTVSVDTSHAPSWATDIRLRSCKVGIIPQGQSSCVPMLIVGPFSLAYDPVSGKKYNPETGAEVA